MHVLRRAVEDHLTRLSSSSLIKPMKREPRHLRGFQFRRDGLGSTKVGAPTCDGCAG